MRYDIGLQPVLAWIHREVDRIASMDNQDTQFLEARDFIAQAHPRIESLSMEEQNLLRRALWDEGNYRRPYRDDITVYRRRSFGYSIQA